jgi:Flp pilus assembly protein TadD
VSLIADALKAAQQEKSRHVPPPASPSGGGFFSVRSGSRSRDGLPRSLVYALVAVAGIGVIGALVALFVSSTKLPATTPQPQVAQPIINPAADTAIKTASPQPTVLTDAASAVPASTVPPSTVPAPLPTAPVVNTPTATVAGSPPLAANAPTNATDSARGGNAARDTAAAIIPAPRPAGTLKITMEDQTGYDGRPLFQQALAAQRRGDVNRAKELYARALDRDPRNADLYNNIGMHYKSNNELDRAEDAYLHAVALNPKLGVAWSNLGVLLDARGRRKEAISALQQAMAVDPANVGVKVNLALQYHAAGLYTDARRLLEEAVRINPAMPEAQYALARTSEAQGDRGSAILHYDLFLSTSNGKFPLLERQVTQHLATLRAGT